MEVLLDISIVIDICSRESAYSETLQKAFDKVKKLERAWLYLGAVQTLVCDLAKQIQNEKVALSFADAELEAKERLHGFSAECHWLAALAGDGESIFAEDNPKNSQLARSVNRLGTDAYLLTRDTRLQKICNQAISPEEFLEIKNDKKPLSFIDLVSQQNKIRGNLESAIHKVLHHGKYILGSEVNELELELAAFSGSNHCISLSSGTDALLAALMAYEVGPGDAIITTPFSFFATAEVIAFVGATPVFADIDPDTYNIDSQEIEKSIEELKSDGKLNLRGIITVDLFGLPCDYDAILPLAKKHGLFIIQDAAQAFGATYKGNRVPSQGHIGCTSFYPAKPLGCYGDGGACFTDDDELAEKLRLIRVHGKGSDKYNNIRIGLNARLDTIQAAILLEKFKIYADELERRQKVAEWYNETLSLINEKAGKEVIKSPNIPNGLTSAWAQYTIQVNDRASLQKKLNNAGIPNVVYYATPLHLLDALKPFGFCRGDFPKAEMTANKVLSLPFNPYLKNELVKFIAHAII